MAVQTMNIPLRPPNVKFMGMFLAPKGWGTDFNLNADWKPQIDACKALGANFVAYWGDIRVGKVDLPGYLVKRRALIEYIASKGMYGLPYGMYDPSVFGTVTNAEACTIFAADAALHSQFPNIIGYVSTDEPFVGGFWSDATVVSNCTAQYNAMKAQVPADFGICSASIGVSGNTFDYTGINATRLNSIAPYCDFFAFHPFATSSASQVAPINTAFPGKQIICPSTVAQQEGTAGLSTLIASIMGLVGFNDVRGFGFWTSVDYDANTYGMMNPDFTPRAIKVNAFQAGNTSVDLRNHRVLRGKPRLTNFKQLGY